MERAKPCVVLDTSRHLLARDWYLEGCHSPRQQWPATRKASGWKPRGPILREAARLRIQLLYGHTRATGFHRDSPPIWRQRRWGSAQAALLLMPHAHPLSMPLSTHVTACMMARLT